MPKIVNDTNVILYDGVCKLCNGWSQFVLRFDTKEVYKLCSVQSPAGQALLQSHGYPLDVFETMLVLHNGKIYEKSDAFFRVMQSLGLPWYLLLVLKIVPKVLRDWMYDRISLNRYQLFGQYAECRLPSPEQARRFL